eukprot:SAG22_NODE_5331_length_1035_cov_1.044872_1_plen_50_part_10
MYADTHTRSCGAGTDSAFLPRWRRTFVNEYGNYTREPVEGGDCTYEAPIP